MLGAGKRRRAAGALYTQIMAQARLPWFYSELCVPDTIEGRLELVTLHCHAVMRRMRHIGPEAGPASQELLQYMFDDIDRSIREIGVGDMSMAKYMKRLGMNFYGRAEAYDQALDGSDDTMLSETLLRNVLATSQADAVRKAKGAASLAQYLRALTARLDGCDLQALQQALPFVPESGQIAA